MKNLESKKIVLVLTLVLVVILGLTVKSFADDDVQAIQPASVVSGNNTSTENTNNTTNNTNTNNITTNNTAINNTIDTANISNSSSYNNTNLPSTGLEDYSMLFIIGGALIVISIVAFKKVKYYKGI